MKNQPGAQWAFMRPFRVNQDGEPYLWRLRIVQTPWFGMYLHKISQPDLQDPHDHPWKWFHSTVLWGGYEEALWLTRGREASLDNLFFIGKYRRKFLSQHSITWCEAHRIIDLHRPTWTLVFVGRRMQQWGFWKAGIGWEPWDRYLAAYNTREVK